MPDGRSSPEKRELSRRIMLELNRKFADVNHVRMVELHKNPKYAAERDRGFAEMKERLADQLAEQARKNIILTNHLRWHVARSRPNPRKCEICKNSEKNA